MKKVFVTGANSFTGQHLLPVLASAGFDTYSLTRNTSHNTSKNYCANITDLTSLKRIINEIKPHYIIHLAGISFVQHPRSLELYETNILGTENLLKAVSQEAPKVQKVILASSASIYGHCDSTNIDEDVCPVPANHYGVSKLAMEYIALTWMGQLPITIARPFNYTGPGQNKKFLIPKIIDHFAKAASQIELGNTHIARDFTDIRVICQYYLKLLTSHNAAGQILNLCSGRLITLMEILNTMKDITGHSIDVRVNSDFVRTSDVLERCGNPNKLYSMIGEQEHPEIKETLTWMLEQAC